MVVRHAFLAALAFASTFAGCAQPAVAPQPDDPGPRSLNDGFTLSDTEGAIEGVVIDDALAPVANVTVRLDNATKGATPIAQMATGPDGRFQFGPLAPQTYRVTTAADLYAETSQLVQVVAGEPTNVRILVGSIPAKEAYVELVIDAGITGCSVSVIWLILGGPCSLVTTYKTQFHYLFADDWQYAVFEADWPTRDAIWMYVELDDDGTCIQPGSPCPGNIKGTPPIRIDGAPESAHGTDKWSWGTTYPPGGEPLDIWVNLSDFGTLFDELNNYAAPVCNLNGGCGGVGTTLEIRFDLYTSIFHNSLPPAPQQYSAIPDG